MSVAERGAGSVSCPPRAAALIGWVENNQNQMGELVKRNGGPGRGQGRKPGSATKLTRSLANELVRQGCDGLSNMVENMMFWRNKATELGELLEEKLKSLDPEIQKEGLGIVRSLLAARENNHKCAVDVAPYTNPRLASITISGDPDNPVKHVHETMTPSEASAAYATMRRKSRLVHAGTPDSDVAT